MPFLPPTPPHIVLVFLTRFEDSQGLLSGIVRYQRTHESWLAFHDDQARIADNPELLDQRRWDGVISRHTNPALVRKCEALKIPLIDLNDTPKFPGVPKLRPDNHAIGRLAAEHLIERGFRHFGFTGFANEGWSCERRDGFIEALQRAGHSCRLHDVPYPGDAAPGWDDAQIDGLSAWLKTIPRPCGLCASFDLRAQQLQTAARLNGYLIPEEIAVVGCNDDHIRCQMATPELSSVAPNSFHAGYRAAEVLAAMLRGETFPDLDERIAPTGVVTRRSTEIRAIDDPHVAAALNLIQQRACARLTVTELLDLVHVSRSQLEKKFRAQIGRSPQNEIRRVQLRKIQELLVGTDLPLKHIAELAGFEHVEYMSVVFKRIVGQTPGEYRRQQQPPAPPVFH